MVGLVTQDRLKAPAQLRAFLKNNNFQDEVLVNTEDGKQLVAGSKKMGKCTLTIKWHSIRGYCIYARDPRDEYLGLPFKYSHSVLMAFFAFEFYLSRDMKHEGKQNSDRFGLTQLWNDIKDMDLSERVKKARVTA